MHRIVIVALVAGCTGATTGTASDTPLVDTSTTSTTTPATGLRDVEVAPSDPNLRYTGRWDHTDPDAPWVGWQGASVEIAFRGTDLIAQIDPGDAPEYFRVILDGDHAGSVKIEATPSHTLHQLATGLPDTDHHVQLVKETYRGTSATFLGFQVRTAEAGTLPLPEPPSRRIVFYGDSNLAGDSLESERNDTSWANSGSHFTYAGIASRRLNASYHNISTSGETLAGALQRFDRTDWYDPASAVDFDAFPAHLVVVNLGANDVGRPEPRIRDDYDALLDALRAAHPTAHIVLFNAFGWSEGEPAGFVQQVAEGRADPDLSWAVFPWVFEQWHGCETDHAGMAQVLVDHVHATLGWEASPSDVVSGFGVGGDVANGGFEQTAPFGGYGWRYHDDPGVTRIEDAAAAHTGSWFVQLADGAQIHQPNPASDGDTVTATVWLRAEQAGQTAEITLDFRDQTLGTEPVASTTEQLALTTEWTQHTLNATARVQLGRPVFHTRLTLAAGAGATVHVDDVTTSLEEQATD
ncbi:MAG: hypothetical protein KTR31_09600 [Myxococcales bacterium]|nr:hypothetical protein [Myxococcales bacterium]